MKEQHVNDIGDLVVGRTADYQVDPPDHVWHGIQAALAEKRHSKPWYLSFPALFSYLVILLVGIWGMIVLLSGAKEGTGFLAFRHMAINDHQVARNNSIGGMEANGNDSQGEEVLDVQLENMKTADELASEMDRNSNRSHVYDKSMTVVTYYPEDEKKVNKNSNAAVEEVASPRIKKREYMLDVKPHKDLREVIFINDDNTPMLNYKVSGKMENFLNIDISTLKPGTYTIRLVKKSGTLDYKKVTYD